MIDFGLALLFGPVLWLGGAMVFDGVHAVLHGLLRSRFRLLRALAWPHAVHHRWIDTRLETNWSLRTANVFCHIVPEYLTQLVYTALLAWLLPWPYAGVVFVLQTGIFAFILRTRGRDVNHRPIPRIDAHPTGWSTPPTYHLLHHVWPDAYYSAYTKAVDRLIGSATAIAGRRFAWLGEDDPFTSALARRIEAADGLRVDDVENADVVVVQGAADDWAETVEAVVASTVERQVPPEVWCMGSDPEDATARHYVSDVRVAFRLLLRPQSEASTAPPDTLARRALFWIRRDLAIVPLGGLRDAAAWQRFRATVPAAPAGARLVRHRMDILTAPHGEGEPLTANP